MAATLPFRRRPQQVIGVVCRGRAARYLWTMLLACSWEEGVSFEGGGQACCSFHLERLDSNFMVRHLPDDSSAVNHGKRHQADARKVLHPQQRLLAEFSLAE